MHRRLGPVFFAVALAGLVTAGPARADDAARSEAGIGAAAALCSLGYAPAKLAFAALGTVVSGLAWVMTGFDQDVARPIFYRSVDGDYVVTPAHLRGRRPLVFVGREPEDRLPDDW